MMVMLQRQLMISLCLSKNFAKNQRNQFKIFSRKCQEARVKLTNTQLDKLKYAAKNKTGTILRLNLKKLDMNNCHIPNNKRNNENKKCLC